MQSQVVGTKKFLFFPSPQGLVLAPHMKHLVKLSLPNIFDG